MLRFNSYNRCAEVFDGVTWYPMTAAAPMVGLTTSAEDAIAWATKKMNEEAAMLKLAAEYPAIKDLMDQQKELQHKIDMVVALVKEEVKA